MLLILLSVLALWTHHNTRNGPTSDGRTEIVFWGNPMLTDQITPVLKAFEKKHPEYKVIYSVPVTKDLTGDAQRLLCAIAGGVPPDVVYFDRFAIGEWASKGAFENLSPWIEQQKGDDPLRIELDDFYAFSLSEASYARPGSEESEQLYGLPTSVDFRMLYLNCDLLRQQGYQDDNGQIVPPRNWTELRNYAKTLSRYQNPQNPGEGLRRIGFAPNIGNSWLYLYAWQAGGEFLDPTRTRVTMDSPEVTRALKFMTDVYDDLGGFKQVEAYRSSFQYQGAMDPFLTGQVAMKIDGNWSLDLIAAHQSDMDFMLVAPPMPQDQLDMGKQPLTWSGGYAYVMPTSSRQKEGAFKLIQFLNSDKSLRFMEQEFKDIQESAGKLYLPRGSAKRRLFEQIIQEEVYDNPDMPRTFKQAYRAIETIAPNTYIRPVTPVGQLLWNKHIEGYEHAVQHNPERVAQPARAQLEREFPKLTGEEQKNKLGELEARIAMQDVQQEVQTRLDAVLQPPRGEKVDWTPYLIAYGLICLIPFLAIYLRFRQQKQHNSYRPGEVGWAMFFASPWFIAMILFIAGPILFSIIISFTHYDVIGEAHYAGLENYRSLPDDPLFSKSLGNTLYMLLRVPLSMALGLGIAMLLKNSFRGVGSFRTIFYLPAIMPVVASSFLWLWFLNPQNGIVNQSLDWCFDTRPFSWIEQHLIGSEVVAPHWFQETSWAKPAMIIMHLWTAGGAMIIWLAGLQAIPNHLYEAARIDGAGPWKQFRHITLPMLTPYILFNLIMGTIGTLQIFSEAFIMTQGGPENATLFYAYYLFKQSFQYFRMGYASAMAWVLFVIVLLLTLLKLWSSKKWVHYQSQ
ncbi:extracellular solute-binding protein [Verrucomicrobiaceae bacterium N1E253]|uniref:Extracellular solute-binding protein n=1 Tax=Oceaniferula marina TaxID=2748318 RepID=A0A851GGV4_9BACT|nr:extracellular solute-binding protein [Oceaniferula marina]NWK56596.1 extracellular solute-binding protein [Oceaniferula marina]